VTPSFSNSLKGSGSFGGRLKALSLVDILEFLRDLNRVGLLSVTAEGTAVGLYLRAGNVVQAISSRETDRLTEALVSRGRITRAHYDEVMRRAAAGERIGKALVAACGLSPGELMEARAALAKQIALSLFEWSAGEFSFIEGEEPAERGIDVDLPITDLIVEGIRTVRTAALFAERLPSSDWVFAAVPQADRRMTVALEPQEEYVLRLVDGARTVGGIVEMSEFRDLETRRILFLLFSIGRLRMGGRLPADDDSQALDEEVEGIVGRYNSMFGRVHEYLMREVGPISEDLLDRSLRQLSETHGGLFRSATLGGDGTVDGAVLRENLRGIGNGRMRSALIDGLNELLYAELLVVRRALGPEHEGRILKTFRGVRQDSGA
jgi:hypothetical protein